MNLQALQMHLTAAGVVFDDGLTDAEIRAAERTFGFMFPQDLRAFLQHALPWPGAYRRVDFWSDIIDLD